MFQQNYGILIIAIGVMVTLIGLLVWAGGLSWFGQLPGDIRMDKTAVKFYFPITSMIIVSVVINILIYLAKKLF